MKNEESNEAQFKRVVKLNKQTVDRIENLKIFLNIDRIKKGKPKLSSTQETERLIQIGLASEEKKVKRKVDSKKP